MKTDDFTRQVLLIEVGTSYTKCGLSGSANPLFVFPYNVFFVFFSQLIHSWIPISMQRNH